MNKVDGISTLSNHFTLCVQVVRNSSPNRTIVDIHSLELGLIPVGNLESGTEVKAHLDSLSHESSRMTRRKFRKVYRKALKWHLESIKRKCEQKVSEENASAVLMGRPCRTRRYRASRAKFLARKEVEAFMSSVGEKGATPTEEQLSSRRALVRFYLYCMCETV